MSESRGRSFGAVAADYERGRPGYPDRVIDVAELPRLARVLDLAAGTGKLTRLLASRFDKVVAVEPDDALRALVRDVEILAGSAERIPLPDSSIDGVFCAEAFHWFDAPAAVAEIARTLRPGGPLVVCFNGANGETEPPWPEEALEAIRRRRRPGESLGGRHLVEGGLWREPFADAPFEEFRFEMADHENVVDTEAAIAYFLSLSGLATQPRSNGRHRARSSVACFPTRSGARRCERRSGLPEDAEAPCSRLTQLRHAIRRRPQAPLPVRAADREGQGGAFHLGAAAAPLAPRVAATGTAHGASRGGGTRTPDLRFWRTPLYQLSYAPVLRRV